ncbi:hypothetical protein FOPG_01655 [Fusarium oxysporum f. sp. conglutinans race 2 54008]|uniref:Uncharacterized protein n=1 Tax=Fusarium oxysporum f. sp. conglutinans race 2 54008 TaxID=1089457 RepID=X0ITK1_FUSOX|nr:hypothetical protein FOPG_01655 [Fusarium oxysporum f. sp. conglutinans race 2 54008]KAI8409847.1 hypothetical protein FOFC_09690 [Fusarium oxysporum]
MDPHSELRGPVVPMCITCSQACERKNGRWVCINCDLAYKYDQGDLKIVSQDSPTTYGNGVVSRPLPGAQEQGHESPSPCLPKTADECENHKAWVSYGLLHIPSTESILIVQTLPYVVEQDSPSSHDQTRDGSVPTLSQVYAFQGSCDSVDHGWRVVDNGPSQERAEPNESYEPMDLDSDDEEPNDEAFHSWIDETTRPGMNVRQRDISHVLDRVAFLGLDRDTSSIALQDDMMLEISDDTDMEE